MSIKTNRALVIGAGMSGLLSAQMLSKHFDEVVVIEKDCINDNKCVRLGAPQFNHPSILLAKGIEIFEYYFSSFTNDLIDAGGIQFDYSKDTYLVINGYKLPRFSSHIYSIACTRLLMEKICRKQLNSNCKIKIIENTEVLQFIFNDKKSLRGVFVLTPYFKTEIISADFILDSSGSRSKTKYWLEKSLGISILKKELCPYAGYVTQRYFIPDNVNLDWTAVGISIKFPDIPYGAAMLKVENNQLLVTLVGISKQYPPTEYSKILNHTRVLSDSIIYDTLIQLKPVSDVAVFKGFRNRINYFDQCKYLPHNLVVLGDALLMFNPIYAQGITMAARAVVKLDHFLTECIGQKFFALQYQKNLFKHNRILWLVTTIEDLKWIKGKSFNNAIIYKLFNWYKYYLIKHMINSKKMTQFFLEVIHMIRSPLFLFNPLIVGFLMFKKGVQNDNDN